MWTRVVPLLIVLVISLLVLTLVLWGRRKERSDKERVRQKAQEEWDYECKFDNPETGAKCTRREFHLENHYHEVNGRFVTWP
jgi:hypothetical protein